MSATLDTQCEAQPDVCAYQMRSGAAPLPSVAGNVSPEQTSTAHWVVSSRVECFMTYLLCFLLPQQDTIVLILVSQLALPEQGTYLELTTR